MAGNAKSTEQIVGEAFAALGGDGSLSAQEVQHIVASTAKRLARALPSRDSTYDPELDGPPMSAEAIKAAAIDVRHFMEMIANLFGDTSDPDWTGDDFAFAVAMKKRSGWKPRKPSYTPAGERRIMAARRVYELMAKQCFDTGQPPKQEAAIAGVMDEFSLARSKVMQGLKEYRESKSWLQFYAQGGDGDLSVLPVPEKMARTHQMLACDAMDREWIRRNPDAHFLGVPAGSALEKQWLGQAGPHDLPD